MLLRVFRSGALVALVLLVACLLLPTSVGAEDEATSAAGLIIDTGEGEPIYVVVTFTGEEMRTLDLLREADLDAVTVEFGGLGSAVCSIATVGCDVSTCRQRLCQTGDPKSPFWQYLEERKQGEWSLSPLGASQAALADGEIAAWAWTGVPPDLPQLSWKEIAVRAGAPDEVAAGDIAGEPAVYVSGLDETQADNSATGAMAGAGVVVLVAVIGGWLVVRQRAGRAS